VECTELALSLQGRACWGGVGKKRVCSMLCHRPSSPVTRASCITPPTAWPSVVLLCMGDETPEE
jgi:hypothetical protein